MFKNTYNFWIHSESNNSWVILLLFKNAKWLELENFHNFVYNFKHIIKLIIIKKKKIDNYSDV